MHSYGIYSVSGTINKTVVELIGDKRIGRVDFHVQHLGGAACSLKVEEGVRQSDDTIVYTEVVGATAVAEGGLQVINVASSRDRVRIRTANSGAPAIVKVFSHFIGVPFAGNLSPTDGLLLHDFTTD
jgi:hypothetical protein